MTNDSVALTLMEFYLDKNWMTMYHGRYDVWLIQKNLMSEYFYLMLKSDRQVKEVTDKAKQLAESIRNSPLTKVLNEEN